MPNQQCRSTEYNMSDMKLGSSKNGTDLFYHNSEHCVAQTSRHLGKKFLCFLMVELMLMVSPLSRLNAVLMLLDSGRSAVVQCISLCLCTTRWYYHKMLNLNIRSYLAFFVLRQLHDVSIKMKFGSLSHTILGPDLWRQLGRRPQISKIRNVKWGKQSRPRPNYQNRGQKVDVKVKAKKPEVKNKADVSKSYTVWTELFYRLCIQYWQPELFFLTRLQYRQASILHVLQYKRANARSNPNSNPNSNTKSSSFPSFTTGKCMYEGLDTWGQLCFFLHR